MTPLQTNLRVLVPGPCSLLVDRGRPHTRSLGVPVGGAADRTALALGNALVGNPPHAVALEISLAGPSLVADGEIAAVLYGAPFAMTSDRQRLRAGVTFTLQAGENLHIGTTATGLRAYLCVRGGFHTVPILGSGSALRPLQAGEILSCPPGRMGRRHVRPIFTEAGDPLALRVVPGPQASWFRTSRFHDWRFTVQPASNRMGLRLEGPPLIGTGRELVSEPVSPGAIQVTSNGQCIVLGVDGQTIGGYPTIAHVIDADLDLLAQLRPGDEVGFRRVHLAEATRLRQQKQAELRAWLTRLRATLEIGDRLART